MTPNADFNKGLFITMGNIDSDDERRGLMNSLGLIDSNMLRTKTDPITGIVSIIKIDYSLVNYDFFIENEIAKNLAKSNDIYISNKLQEWFKIMHDHYVDFQKNYNDMKKESSS